MNLKLEILLITFKLLFFYSLLIKIIFRFTIDVDAQDIILSNLCFM